VRPLSALCLLVLLLAGSSWAFDLSGSFNALALDLWRASISSGDLSSDENLVFCPLGAYHALSLLAEGASGETRGEILAALRAREEDMPSLRSSFRDYLKGLSSADQVEARFDASLWIQRGFDVSVDFLSLSRLFYLTELRHADMAGSPGEAASMVNGWIAERSRGLLGAAVDPSLFGRDQRLLLVNLFYFKGLWREQFERESTSPMAFRTASGREVEVMAMSREGRIRYASVGPFRAVSLPYRGGFSALVVLADELSSFAHLGRGEMEALLRSLSYARVLVKLPRLNLEEGYPLDQALRAIGVRRAFSDGAHFPRISREPTRVSRALQRTALRVDEEGTEAASVTAVGMVATSLNPMPEELVLFVVDRPFLLVLRDERRDLPLLWAFVAKPK